MRISLSVTHFVVLNTIVLVGAVASAVKIVFGIPPVTIVWLCASRRNSS